MELIKIILNQIVTVLDMPLNILGNSISLLNLLAFIIIGSFFLMMIKWIAS